MKESDIVVPHENIIDTIQRTILERICFLEYRAGHQLKEADLTKEFGVSRTPVRDALSRIAHLELIETRNGVGTVVIRLSNQKIEDVYETRLKLAILIGDLSNASIATHHLDKIRSLLSRAHTLTPKSDSRSYVLINHELHQLICSLISNSVLQSFWRQTYYQAASIWYDIAKAAGEEALESLVDELTNVEIALKANDLKALGFIQRTYIGYGYSRIQRYLFD